MQNLPLIVLLIFGTWPVLLGFIAYLLVGKKYASVVSVISAAFILLLLSPPLENIFLTKDYSGIFDLNRNTVFTDFKHFFVFMGILLVLAAFGSIGADIAKFFIFLLKVEK